MLYAFDLLELDGDDLRDLPLIERKGRLKKLIGIKARHAILYLMGDGATMFRHVSSMGLEGIVSKRTDAPYRSGPSKTQRAMRCAVSVRKNGARSSASCASRADPTCRGRWRRVEMQLGQTAKRRLGQKRQSSERRGNLERDRQRGLLHLDYAYFVVSNHIE